MGFAEANCCQQRKCNHSQRHVHEVIGSVQIAEPGTDPHNHRFATVSGEAMPTGTGDHVHEICFRTDFYEEHVHFAEAMTDREDGHCHRFRVASLIDNPIGD